MELNFSIVFKRNWWIWISVIITGNFRTNYNNPSINIEDQVIFQQKGASPHYGVSARKYLNNTYCDMDWKICHWKVTRPPLTKSKMDIFLKEEKGENYNLHEIGHCDLIRRSCFNSLTQCSVNRFIASFISEETCYNGVHCFLFFNFFLHCK